MRKKNPRLHSRGFFFETFLLVSVSDYQRRPPPPPPPVRGAFGRASLTVSGRPPMSAPFIPAIAARPSSAFGISTKPKPRDRPVSRSWMTCADSTVPNLEKAERNCSSLVVNGRLPTKIFTGFSQLSKTTPVAQTPSFVTGDSYQENESARSGGLGPNFAYCTRTG